MSEQSTDAIFARFDADFDVDIERHERFDDVVDAIDVEMTSEINEFLDRSESVTDLNIENFDVVVDEMISEVVCEIVDEIVEILSFSLLKLRFEAFLTIFFA